MNKIIFFSAPAESQRRSRPPHQKKSSSIPTLKRSLFRPYNWNQVNYNPPCIFKSISMPRQKKLS